MESNWITVGFVCKIPIERIPELEKYLDNMGRIIFSKLSAGKLILKEETLPSGGAYEQQ